MTEKVKLPQKVADAIVDLRKVHSKYGVVAAVEKGKSDYPTLSKSIGIIWSWTHEEEGDGRNADRLLEVLVNGYEVDPVYTAGDWVIYSDKIYEIYQIPAMATVHIKNSRGSTITHMPIQNIRQATPEEIKVEKERRVWAGIGRKVGEFKERDTGFDFDGHVVPGFTALNETYANGKLQGFYPAESFVSFEEAESDEND